MKEKIIRSPFFYVGDKFKLMNQIKEHFPREIKRFIEPFVGGGTVFLNTDAKEYLLNDIDKNICDIHKMLILNSNNPKSFFDKSKKLIKKYGLSKSFLEDIVPQKLRKDHVKTYYAKFNKNGYERMREDYNKLSRKDPFLLYFLLIYGFNRMEFGTNP